LRPAGRAHDLGDLLAHLVGDEPIQQLLGMRAGEGVVVALGRHVLVVHVVALRRRWSVPIQRIKIFTCRILSVSVLLRPMTQIAIHTEGLTKRFGDFTAVEDLSLQVADGAVVSLLGPNGAGKTTTVRMLATLLRPDAGHARVGGYDVVTDAARVRELVSLTGQFAALDKNLSGGEKRRVDLAAGLIDTPHVLVLDEPTTGLDPRSRQVVWSTIRQLVQDGVTLLLTTQYLEEADALADRVVLIDRGTEVASGTPAQLKAQVGEQRVDIIAADSAAFTALCDLLWERFEVTPSPEQRTISIPAPREAADLAEIAAAVDESGISVDEVALRRPTLDDAFLALTGHTAHEPTPEVEEAAV